MPTVIVVGPAACGKTRNADAIARGFGCDFVVDDWCPGDQLAVDALHLTCAEPGPEVGVKIVDFSSLGLSPSTGSNTREVPRIASRRQRGGAALFDPLLERVPYQLERAPF